MKINIYNILFGFCLILFLMSCEKELDIDPIANEVIQPDLSTLDDIETALFGVYSGFKSDRLYGTNILSLGEWPADNLKIASQNLGFGAIIHQWDYTESFNDIEETWVGLYDVVRRANFVIHAVDNYTGDDMDIALEYKAQALTLRSLSLLDAHKLFASRYQDGSELSVAYVTDPNDILQKLPRLTTNEIFGLIQADLEFAVNNLSSSFEANFVSKSLVYGLLARKAMFENNWQSVIENCDLAITSTPTSLSTIDNYSDMWGESDEDGEAIFKIAFDSDDENIGDVYFNDGIGPVFDPSADLLSLYSSGDVRIPSFFMLDAQFGVIISKFFGPASQRGFHEPFVMRLSEMYLLRAEAYSELGNDTDALQSLDVIRTNRIEGFVEGNETGDELKTAIRVERRKELAYEGFRFSDLARWNEDVVRNDCTADECFLSADDFKLIYPIPRAELFANENMVQNPGY